MTTRKSKTVATINQPSTSTEAAGATAVPEDVIPPDDDVELIDNLKNDGITTADIDKLKKHGYYTIRKLSLTSTRELAKIKGITEQKAEKLGALARRYYPVRFTVASEVFRKLNDTIRITTGSKNLDNLLGGGIETGVLTEVFGIAGSGKTQLCMQLCVACQLPIDQGGAEGKALYIDTYGGFKPTRVIQIAERYKLVAEDVLDNIAVTNPGSFQDMEESLIEASCLLTQSRYALLVVDSVIGHLRNEFQGRGELAERQQKLGRFLHKLTQICNDSGVAAVIVNEMSTSVDGSAMFCDPNKPVGGNVIAHKSDTRLYFKKLGGNNRRCKIFHSSEFPSEEADFALTKNGIEDTSAA